jgi:hypothetical protein
MTDERPHLVHGAYVSLLKRADEWAADFYEKGRKQADRFERHAVNAALDLRDARNRIDEILTERAILVAGFKACQQTTGRGPEPTDAQRKAMLTASALIRRDEQL